MDTELGAQGNGVLGLGVQNGGELGIVQVGEDDAVARVAPEGPLPHVLYLQSGVRASNERVLGATL